MHHFARGHEPDGYRFAADLLSSPECTHIITMDNPEQNFHIRRLVDGWEFIVPGIEQDELLLTEKFESISQLRSTFATDQLSFDRLTRAIWHDISSYPDFPLQARYHPGQQRIKLDFIPDDEHMQALGTHQIYGSVNVVIHADGSCVIEPNQQWIVISHPSRRLRIRHAGTNYSPAQSEASSSVNLLAGMRHALSRARDPATPITIIEKPATLAVYGKPPEDWSTHSVTLRFS